jgi:hypothetical protein
MISSPFLFEAMPAMLALVELSRPLLSVGVCFLAVRAYFHHVLDRPIDHLCPDRIHYLFLLLCPFKRSINVTTRIPEAESPGRAAIDSRGD